MDYRGFSLLNEECFHQTRGRLLLAFCLIVYSFLPVHCQIGSRIKAKTPNGQSNSFLKSYGHPYQNRLSLVAGIGLAGYSGDICRIKDSGLQHHYLNFGLSAGLAYRFTNYISACWDNSYQLLKARARPETWGEWGFRSHLLGSTIILQINTTSKTAGEQYNRNLDMYFLAGLGVFYCSTKVNADAIIYDWLKPMLKNAQKPIAFTFPIGIGATWRLTDQASLGIEAVYYFTTTDLLDGASLVADSKPRPDNYLTIQIRFTRQLFQLFHYKEYMQRK